MAFVEPQPDPFAILEPPYGALRPVAEADIADLDEPGGALVWDLRGGHTRAGLEAVRGRRPGVALLVMLPPAEEIGARVQLFELIEQGRPHSILPHHRDHSAAEWASLLRRTPSDLAAEVIDYLSWVGLRMDGDTKHLARRILELSAELRTVSALARGLYLSRRALGRRFMQRGLPVPSHWLHFGRVLRAALRLQGSSDNLFKVACALGYPDGFALSNQMYRLTGVRPSISRRCLGWEWMVDAWMRTEGLADERGYVDLSKATAVASRSEEESAEPGDEAMVVEADVAVDVPG